MGVFAERREPNVDVTTRRRHDMHITKVRRSTVHILSVGEDWVMVQVDEDPPLRLNKHLTGWDALDLSFTLRVNGTDV